ncbi:hypothetical protein OG209_09875 [Streptomyces sp. NBC_01383]|uniref:hypothetical protein n=1 Tax=Streptomyces sp. NBC_01383 TaxID=2903846 RepID=UPI00324E5E8E
MMYALSEHEKLGETGQEQVDAFAGHFTASPRVAVRFVLGSGHNTDHHAAGRAFHLEQLAFALQCSRTAV